MRAASHRACVLSFVCGTYTYARSASGAFAMCAAASEEASPAAGGWLEAATATHERNSLLPVQHRSTVLALVEALRAADERTLLSQLESFLRLFELRELLQSIEAERDRAQGKPHARPRSIMFATFLEWAYGKEEGAMRNTQLQRLAHWFHWQRDIAVYRRLLSAFAPTYGDRGDVSLVEAGAASPTPSTKRTGARTRCTPLSIAYFFELAPRLPQLLDSLHEHPLAQVESKLHTYLSVRPLSQLRAVLATDFAGFQRPAPAVKASDDAAAAAVAPATMVIVEQAEAEEDEQQQQHTFVPDQSMNQLADVAMAVECVALSLRVDSAAAAAAACALTSKSESATSSSVSASEPEEDNTTPLLSRTSSTDTTILDNTSAELEQESDENGDNAATGASDTPEPAAASARKKRPRIKRQRDKADDSNVEPPSPPAPPHIACIGSSTCVPIELLRLGVATWERQRKSEGIEAQYRQAMDDALVELMWDLSEQLPDGARLELPDFKRARRSASRQVAAEHSARMEGERRCTTLRDILDKLDVRAKTALDA